MEQGQIIQEIRDILEKMSFTEDLEAIEPHQGATSRFSIRIRSHEGEWSEEEGGPRQSFTNMLIGERGGNLAALEHLIKKIIKKKCGEDIKFTLDINDYRMRRLEDLKQDVKGAVREVRLYHKEVPLRSMSSFERRIVHLLLAEYPDITTESFGQEPERKVLIKPYP